MYLYIDPSDDSFLQNDEIYQRIIKQLNPLISNLKSGEGKQVVLKMISECYHKYHKSIKTRSQSYTELMLSAIMALLVEQNREIESMERLAKTRPR
ncbi:MAG: hypothetical protein L0H53_04155 [Candidatus Nitrosocosmicus sp.]|nr:hypothetical protein [Candidatus Nitrosocosmicus sp.]